MNHLKYELLGIFGFFISGIIFIIAGIRSGDLLSITGSVIWTSACILWMVPLLSKLKGSRDGRDLAEGVNFLSTSDSV